MPQSGWSGLIVVQTSGSELCRLQRCQDRYISSLNAAKPKRADDDEDSDGVETTGVWVKGFSRIMCGRQ